jgi:long-chain acyl-CoA synthetase
VTVASLPNDVEMLRAYDTAAGVRPWAKLQGATAWPKGARNTTALDLFRSPAPDAPAILYFDAVLSYRDVDDLSNRLAGWLFAHGVGRGVRVAIILQNTPQFLIAAVAAWKLGAIVVGLNPMYRKAELEKLFADCAPRAIICHDDQWSTVVAAAGGLVPAELVLWTSGRELQSRNETRVLPPESDPAPIRRLPASSPIQHALSRRSNLAPTMSGCCSTRRAPRDCRKERCSRTATSFTTRGCAWRIWGSARSHASSAWRRCFM